MVKAVITGGPGSGKTSTIKELESRGYLVISETAREIIREESEKNEGILPWTNLAGFQEKVFTRQLEKEKEYEAYEGIMFLDRGLVDGIAYYKLGGIKPSSRLYDAISRTEYEAVFYLEPLSNYSKDGERKEDRKTALRISKLIVETYQETDYDLIKIPRSSISDRADRIEETMKERAE